MIIATLLKPFVEIMFVMQSKLPMVATAKIVWLVKGTATTLPGAFVQVSRLKLICM